MKVIATVPAPEVCCAVAFGLGRHENALPMTIQMRINLSARRVVALGVITYSRIVEIIGHGMTSVLILLAGAAIWAITFSTSAFKVEEFGEKSAHGAFVCALGICSPFVAIEIPTNLIYSITNKRRVDTCPMT
jgi:hypothetical protein